MISINSVRIEELLLKYADEIDSTIAVTRVAIQNLRHNPTRIVNRVPQAFVLTQAQMDYLDALIVDLPYIVIADNAEINRYKGIFTGIISSVDMKANGNRVFRDELINRLGYKQLRDDFYPKYFEGLKIKACVYCNSQLTVTVRKVNNERSAKFQVDHVLPKSEYPCFSISFYNLYPVCGPCNGTKNAQEVNFNLYSNRYQDYSKSHFKFRIDKASLIKYRLNGDPDLLKIEFDDNGSGLDETFAIKGIYNTQKDIAEELILKSMIYKTNYREGLRRDLTNLYNDKAPILDRLMMGNYTKEKDIHKRPMAKFTMDIAKQLNLIK